MLFKLSIKNIKKSFKDYAIYFITLVLGVSIFYMFNSLDSQQAMLDITQSTRDIIQLMLEILGVVSVFVAITLGLLIVYANRFLINRRKKEFGIYMTLGMNKRQISKILLMETLIVGILSLGVGLLFGIFGSQLMSIVVAKLFQADMKRFEFVFSMPALIKTCVYFAVMFLATILFNTFTISRYKIINLLTSNKKNEKVKMKNPIISVIIFIIASILLGYSYWKVSTGIHTLSTIDKVIPIIILGIIGTILVFWSLSGFILRLIQNSKKMYFRDTNMFVLRQINNKINTDIVSISVICLLLFMTITILSSALSVRNTLETELEKMTPVDINLYKTANLPEKSINMYGKEVVYTKEQREDSKITIKETLENNEFDMSLLKDVIEIPIYVTEELKFGNFFNNHLDEVKKQFPMINFGSPEMLIKVSDYNKIAKLYGIEQYQLKDNEYIVVCNFDGMMNMRNMALKEENILKIAGKEYKNKNNECNDGFIELSTNRTNTGIILVPDSCNLTEDIKEKQFLVANYNANTKEEKKEIENQFQSEGELTKKLEDKKIELDGVTKISITESSIGLATIVTFIAIYLGIIFLIASAAILALKQLTESSDNKQRYEILRKIGCDEKMINKALFRQIGIFFLAPLILAIIHSIFGIQFVLLMLDALVSKSQLMPSIILTAISIGLIYGIYFIATYIESKNIIKEE